MVRPTCKMQPLRGWGHAWYKWAVLVGLVSHLTRLNSNLIAYILIFNTELVDVIDQIISFKSYPIKVPTSVLNNTLKYLRFHSNIQSGTERGRGGLQSKNRLLSLLCLLNKQ